MLAVGRNSRSGVEADTAAETEKGEAKVYKSAKLPHVASGEIKLKYRSVWQWTDKVTWV